MQVLIGDKVLVSDLRIATNLVARTRGLMLAAPLKPGQGLDIRPCNSIHMMFMRFRIDAVFYDRAGRVMRVASNVPTWRGLAFGGRNAAGVLELPAGSAMSVVVGDQLEWQDFPTEAAG